MVNVEDIQNELAQLATFLDDGYFGNEATELQRNLLIELVVMKMCKLSKGEE